LSSTSRAIDLCDELFNRTGSRHLDAHVGAVINRYQRTGVATLRWFHDGLGITATELQELLDDRGIIVEPTLRGRPFPTIADAPRPDPALSNRGHGTKVPAHNRAELAGHSDTLNT
jgi:hypothetical protein